MSSPADVSLDDCSAAVRVCATVAGWPVSCIRLPAVDDLAKLTQARSMLILLLAACKQTQTVLTAAANALDTDLTADLGAMIERTEKELVELTVKIDALSN